MCIQCTRFTMPQSREKKKKKQLTTSRKVDIERREIQNLNYIQHSP